jgi:Tfp pilus assembly protein PilE
MIVVVVVGILTGIAVPAYTDHIVRGRSPRASARCPRPRCAWSRSSTRSEPTTAP